MDRTCVVVADSKRARIFEAEPVDKKDQRQRYRLEEKIDLINMWANASDVERRANGLQKPKGSAPPGNDRRQKEEEHDDRIFAKEVSQKLHEFFKEHKAYHLYLIAPARFLGALRAQEKMLSRDVHDIKEFPKQLSGLSVDEIKDFLEAKVFH